MQAGCLITRHQFGPGRNLSLPDSVANSICYMKNDVMDAGVYITQTLPAQCKDRITAIRGFYETDRLETK